MVNLIHPAPTSSMIMIFNSLVMPTSVTVFTLCVCVLVTL